MIDRLEFEDDGTAIDRYDPVSVTLGEWAEMGFYVPYTEDAEGAVVPAEQWAWDYIDLAQYRRVSDKFLAHYYFRAAQDMPPFRFAYEYRRLFNELMPKYRALYGRVDAGIDPLQASAEFTKGRDIFSDFPATMLSGNSDYASTGNDREQDITREGDIVGAVSNYVRYYNDVDVSLITEVGEQLFSSFIAPTVPLW